ncbi:prolyl oligopeptidase family serine peptidase [Schlesneria sp. T3-172]|uniref:S9 family peptidase n=1 Tax=Schlesneria TaxID=656899 RepID=UPI002F002341
MKTWTLSLTWLSMILGAVRFAANEAVAQTDPRKPAAIEAQDVPIVPPEMLERLAQYQNVRGAAFRGWASDGTGILINTRFGNSSQLHRVYTPGGRREQITFSEEPVTGRFLPQSASGSILLLKDRGGNENDQIYLFDRQQYTTALLTDGTSRNRLGAMDPNGNRFLFSSNRRNGRDGDLYLCDLGQPNGTKLLMQVENQTWHAHDWSPDGKQVLISRYVSINETYPAVLDIDSGARTDLPVPPDLASDEKAAFGTMAFSADGKSIFLTSDAGNEFRRLAKLDRSTHSYQWLTTDLEWDVNELAVNRVTSELALTVNEDGATRLFLLAQGNLTRRELQVPLGVISGVDFSADGKRIGFTLARPDAPPDAYSILLETGELTRWTFSEVGGLDPESFVTPTRIRYRTFDGRMIPAYYFQPRLKPEQTRTGQGGTEPRFPVYISIHGGPEAQYQPFFSPNIQYYLNELGIAVICPNVRGSSGYGKTYLKLDNAEKREDSVKDIGALLDWIEQQPELDASRIAVAGGSYGGYMTLASLTHFGDRIKAGIDVVGIANFVTFLEKTAGYRVDLRRAEYGDERLPEMKAFFERISPLNHADKIRSALLVVHGRNDPRVPFYEAEQIASKVRANDRTVWTVYADNEGHGFAKKDNADYVRAVEVLFLKANLIP